MSRKTVFTKPKPFIQRLAIILRPADAMEQRPFAHTGNGTFPRLGRSQCPDENNAVGVLRPAE